MRRSWNLARGDKPNSKATADSSLENDAWVFVRRRNSRLRFSRALVVRIDFHMARALLHGPEQIADLPVRLQSHPAQYVSGIPSAAILLSISHPIRCSTRCLANVRARISGPMIAL